MKRSRSHSLTARLPNHGTVVAYLALFIAIGGTSVAAVSLTKNSVGSKQIKAKAVGKSELKRNAVKSSKLKRNAVNSSKVRNASLTGADLAPGTRTAPLISGETITGFIAIQDQATAASEFFGASGSFQIPPKAPIPFGNIHLVTGISPPTCPSVGQAAAGHLCIYQVRSGNVATTLNSPVPRTDDPSTMGGATSGFYVQVQSSGSGPVTYTVSWAYQQN